MSFFHVTSAKNVPSIDQRGFEDTRGYFMIDSEYEWVEEGKAYREWLVPAAILNAGRYRRIELSEAESDTTKDIPRSFLGRDDKPDGA